MQIFLRKQKFLAYKFGDRNHQWKNSDRYPKHAEPSGELNNNKNVDLDEKGVPLKALYTMISGETTKTMDFKYSNYSFSDIPNSTFIME